MGKKEDDWAAKKLKMAGMTAPVRKWDSATSVLRTNPNLFFDKSVNAYSLASFEVWHKQHASLRGAEVPEQMRVGADPRGPLAAQARAAHAARSASPDRLLARAYGGGAGTAARLPAAARRAAAAPRGAAGARIEHAPDVHVSGSPLLHALFQDVGAGDGTWTRANPRALHLLPGELLRCQQYMRAAALLTNPHFLLRKLGERGVAETRRDLEDACAALRQALTRGGMRAPAMQGVATEVVVAQADRLAAYLELLAAHGPALAAEPRALLALAAAAPPGSVVQRDAAAAAAGVAAAVAEVHAICAPARASLSELAEKEEAAAARAAAPAEGGEGGPAPAELAADVGAGADAATRLERGARLVEGGGAARLLALLARLQAMEDHGALAVCAADMADAVRESRAAAGGALAMVKEVALASPEGKEMLGEAVLAAEGAEDAGAHWEKEAALLHVYELLHAEAFGAIPGEEGGTAADAGGAYEPPQALAAIQLAPVPAARGARRAAEEKMAPVTPGSRPGTGASAGRPETGLSLRGGRPGTAEAEAEAERAEEVLAWAARASGAARERLSLVADAAGGPRAVVSVAAPPEGAQIPTARAAAAAVMAAAAAAAAGGADAGAGERWVSGGAWRAGEWRRVCVFVAGTVGDMLAERRMLARFVLPALRAACRARRLSLEWVLCGAGSPAALGNSLRWVRDSALPLPDGTTLPFSLAVLGDKVGWVPPLEDRAAVAAADPAARWVLEEPYRRCSLVQLEAAQALRPRGDGADAREAVAFTLLRDSRFVESEAFAAQQAGLLATFRHESRALDDLAAEFKAALLASPAAAARAMLYRTTLAGIEHSELPPPRPGAPPVRVQAAVLSGLVNFGEQAFAALFRAVDALAPAPARARPADAAALRAREQADLRALRAAALSDGVRAGVLQELLAAVTDNGSKGGNGTLLLALVGPAGCGKSVLMAAAHAALRALQRAGGWGTRAEAWAVVMATRAEWHADRDLHLALLEGLRARGRRAPPGDSSSRPPSNGALLPPLSPRAEEAEEAEEYVGEVSLAAVEAELLALAARGERVVLFVDGASPRDAQHLARIFHRLRERARAAPAAPGALRLVLSCVALEPASVRDVRALPVPPLTPAERRRVAWDLLLDLRARGGPAAAAPALGAAELERLCARGAGAGSPRYLRAAVAYLAQVGRATPSELGEALAALQPTLAGLPPPSY